MPEFEVSALLRWHKCIKNKEDIFNSYWSSNWWRMDEERYTSPEVFEYAKEKGLMFESITISHDVCVKKIMKLANTITMEHW